ncbi:TonB-dependent receptor [Luteibacter yeojuensis]
MRHAMPCRARVIAAAIAVALLGIESPAVFAQSTVGTISGAAPAAAGESVRVENPGSGFSRDVPVDERGRFTAASLPIGIYRVTLLRDGKPVETRDNIQLRVGTTTQVSFAEASSAAGPSTENLAAVTVSANAIPAIDTTSVDSRSVVTATELAKLPVARSAESVALLAPGTVAGNPAFGGVAFSGSSVAENAYYINGFNTSNPLTNLGGTQLPYGAIDQQETLTAGYGPQYGRSDGGVISQVGKHGTNEWHFGAQIQWLPRSLRAGPANSYYVQGKRKGELYDYNREDKSWSEIINGYGGGALIKDKLFFYAAYEVERQQGSSIGSIDGPYETEYRYRDPRWYAKVDWNITDNHILEFTGVSSKQSYQANQFFYDYDSKTEGAFRAQSSPTKTSTDIGIVKYTGYLTDDLTLSAMYGKLKNKNYTQYPGYDADQVFISGASNQNPALNGGVPLPGSQPFGYLNDPSAANRTRNLRIDLSEHLGDHTISAGIDNQVAVATDQGSIVSGPDGGYWWIYTNASGDPTAPIDIQNGVPAPVGYPGGEDGYYVSRYRYRAVASAQTTQRAQYIEDAWQVSDRFLLKLGLRNDQFTNYNTDHKAYIRQTKPQWAPRVGFAWDVGGDASFKVFGNVGRYYLALPNSVAIRGAGGNLFTNEYFTYTGINADGTPSGLTALPPGHAVAGSAAALTGAAPDPETVTARHLKAEFQDEYVLGFQHQWGPEWVYGVKGVVRNLRNALDDVCDVGTIQAAARAQGVDTDALSDANPSCYIFNPGKASDFTLLTDDGARHNVHVTNDDFGFPHLKRKYAGLEFTLEHPFDGTWYGSFNYVYSHSFGNTEGPVRSDIRQSDIAATTSWDYSSLMVYSNGDQANDQRHQFKFNGYWQMASEWLLGANLAVVSGLPKGCLGAFGGPDLPPEDRDPSGYGKTSYYFCDGRPEPPGRAGRTPWQYTLSGNLEYRPEWAGKKLAFNLYVFNILNKQRPIQYDSGYGSTNDVPVDSYQRVVYRQQPRYVRVAVSYDF